MYFFFFSSRRRHTRCSRDWSSDVCSSDLCLLVPSIATRLLRSTSRPAWISTPTSRPFKRKHASAPTPKPFTILHPTSFSTRSEEHTSELQSRLHLVCRLLLEKQQSLHSTTQTLQHI